MLIVVRRSNARSACSLGFKSILSKRGDCRSAADGAVHAGGRVAVEKDEPRNRRRPGSVLVFRPGRPKVWTASHGAARSCVCYAGRGRRSGVSGPRCRVSSSEEQILCARLTAALDACFVCLRTWSG
jgi:hypothetical protein